MLAIFTEGHCARVAVVGATRRYTLTRGDDAPIDRGVIAVIAMIIAFTGQTTFQSLVTNRSGGEARSFRDTEALLKFTMRRPIAKNAVIDAIVDVAAFTRGRIARIVGAAGQVVALCIASARKTAVCRFIANRS
jgi:hypothetical protein